MFSADGEDAAVEADSPSSPLLLPSSSSSPNIAAAVKNRNPLLPSDSSNAMHNVAAVEQAMAHLATSDSSTFDIPLDPQPTQPPEEDSGHQQLDGQQQQQQQQRGQDGQQASDGALQASQPPSTRIEVIGVPSELRYEELVRGIFDRFGNIQSVRLSSDAAAGQHTAIIQYADQSSAADAINLDGFELNGSKLRVSYAPAALQLDDGMLSAESVHILPAAQQSAVHPASASAPVGQPVSFPRPPTVNVAIPIASPVAKPVSATVASTQNSSSIEPTSTTSAFAAAASAPSSSPAAPVARPAPTDVILHSPAFLHFKAHVPLSRIATSTSQSWSFYEIGPKPMLPLILLHGSSGTAAVYFQQLLALSGRGYRVISASWPPYWTVKEWTDGFLAFLDAMHIERAHIFGASLGGMLALQFATEHPSRVDSLILCNAFVDTLPFVKGQLWTQSLYWMPEFLVKEVMLQSFPTVSFYADTVDFIVAQLDTLTAGDVASRLTLNSTQHFVSNLERIDQSRVLLILPQDEVTLPEQQRERLLQALPNAKQAMIKEGGDFPFISVADECNLFLLVHLRGMNCLPLLVEEERAERDRQLEAAAERVLTPRALDALKEPDSLVRAAVPMPMFRPTQSAVAGGMSVASAYEAITEQAEDEKALEDVQQNNSQINISATTDSSPRHFTRQVSGPSLTQQTLGETIIRLSREEEEERERQRQEREESLRLQADVEARLKEIRERQEEERKARLHEETVMNLEREKRRESKSKEALAQLGIEGEGVDKRPARSFKRTSIFDE